MIDLVRITRTSGVVTAVELMDSHGNVIDELPCTGVEYTHTNNTTGEFKLVLDGRRLLFEDN